MLFAHCAVRPSFVYLVTRGRETDGSCITEEIVFSVTRPCKAHAYTQNG
jgi:hypothetical protein